MRFMFQSELNGINFISPKHATDFETLLDIIDKGEIEKLF